MRVSPNIRLGPALSSATVHAPSSLQPSSPPFEAGMAELDELQTLRAHDPAAALQRLAERGPVLLPQWARLAPAEDTLLRARLAMHTGASHLLVGQHADAGRELSKDRL